MLHSFTRNYNDLSTEAGFQFEFYCVCCGNGFKSTFVRSSTYGQKQKSERIGRMASTLGGFLGGRLNAEAMHWATALAARAPSGAENMNKRLTMRRQRLNPNFKNAPAATNGYAPIVGTKRKTSAPSVHHAKRAM